MMKVSEEQDLGAALELRAVLNWLDVGTYSATQTDKYDRRLKTRLALDYRNSALIHAPVTARKYDATRDNKLRLPLTAMVDGKLVKLDVRALGIGKDTRSRVITEHQVEGVEVPALIDTGAAVGMVHSGLVEAINAHVFEVAVPVRIK